VNGKFVFHAATLRAYHGGWVSMIDIWWQLKTGAFSHFSQLVDVLIRIIVKFYNPIDVKIKATIIVLAWVCLIQRETLAY